MTDDQPPPAPPRRDNLSPAARHHGPKPPLTREQQALRDAYLAELWPVCPEYHPGDRPRPYRTAA